METQQDKHQSPELRVRCLCTWSSQSFCDSEAQPGAGFCVVTYPAVLPSVEVTVAWTLLSSSCRWALSSPVWERKETQFSEAPGEWTPVHQCRQGRSLERQLLGKCLLRDPHPCVPAKPHYRVLLPSAHDVSLPSGSGSAFQGLPKAGSICFPS